MMRKDLQQSPDPGGCVLNRSALAAPLVARCSLVVLFLVHVAVATAEARKPPVLEALRDLESRTPVVLIPGITGTRLKDSESGRILWGNGRSVFFPRDGGVSLARPLGGDPLSSPRIVPAGPVEKIRVGPLTFKFYARIIRLMEANGYRFGDLSEPRAEDDFFIFDYDWRQGNVLTARELAKELEGLRRTRNDDVLHVHLICQSNAARVARYLIKYGGAPLVEAEAGTARPPPNVVVDKLIFVGTDNGGALGILEDLNRGRGYLPILGRRFRQETLFTFQSLFEGLPRDGRGLFLDEEGEILDIDLYHPEAWQRYQWSIWTPKVERRLAKGRRPELFADPEERRAFLARSLEHARRLHHLLSVDSPVFGAKAYYMVQNVYRPTDRRALLVRRKGRWETFFIQQKRLRKDEYLLTRAAAPGDGHATRQSQMDLSPQELTALARPPVFVDAWHREVVKSEATHRYLLQFLAP